MSNKRSIARKIQKAQEENTGLVNLEITMADVQTLVQQNPLFSSQLQNIALVRRMKEMQSELNQLRNGKEVEDSRNGAVNAPSGKN